MGVAENWGCTGVGRPLECKSVTIKLQRTGCPVPRVVNLSVVAVHNFILQPVAL